MVKNYKKYNLDELLELSKKDKFVKNAFEIYENTQTKNRFKRLIKVWKLNKKGLDENKTAARAGGAVAGRARKDLELESGKKVSTKKNYLPESNTKKRLK